MFAQYFFVFHLFDSQVQNLKISENFRPVRFIRLMRVYKPKVLPSEQTVHNS